MMPFDLQTGLNRGGPPRREQLAHWRATVLAVLLANALLLSVGHVTQAQQPVGDPAVESAPAFPTLDALGNSTGTVEIPDYYLSLVQVDGKVEADRVQLEITTEIVINRGEGWRRIPLRLDRLHLWKREYSGPGEEAPDVTLRPADEGVSWMIRGVGRHQLKLFGWAPLKRTGIGGQVQLSLPPLPPQFEARVNLLLPVERAVIRPHRNLTVIQTEPEPDGLRVKASVIGSSLDLTWQTPSPGGEPAGLVQSRFHLKPNADRLTLTVEQKIFQQSAVESLTVTLPDKFRLLDITGPNYRVHEVVADQPGKVRLNFAGASPGSTELQWTFEREFPAPGELVDISGLHVENALREEGVVRIDEFENFKVLPRPQQSQYIHALSVDKVRGWSQGQPLMAFEYLKQPFRMMFGLEPVAAYFSIDPVVELSLRDLETELKLQCPLRFDRGGITEFEVRWPDWEAAGWQFFGVAAEGPLENRVSAEVFPGDGRLRVFWPEPLNQRATVWLTFRQPRTVPIEEGLSLTLPTPVSSRTAAPLLRVQPADHLEATLTGGTGNLAAAPSEGDSGNSPTVTEQRFTVARPHEPVEIQLVAHERRINASAVVELTQSSPAELSVRQTLQLDVRYGALSGVDLVLPAALLAQIPQYAAPEAVDVTLDGKRLALVSASGFLKALFPTPRKGAFELRVDYRFPMTNSGGAQDIDLPLIRLDQTPYHSVQCLVESIDTVQVRSDVAGWEPVRTSPRGAMWMNSLKSGEAESIPLTVGRALKDTAQQYQIEKLLLRTRFLADGGSESWAAFLVDSPPQRLTIRFPANSEFKEFQVDGVRLTAPISTSEVGDAVDVSLPLPRTRAQRLRVEARYRTPAEHPVGFTHRFHLAFPQFPPSVWVDETQWEVQLPEGHHLFLNPDLDPQFRWMRHVLMWRRDPTASYLQQRAQDWAGALPEEFRFDATTGYAFRRSGPVGEASLRSMNRALIVLLGAGSTLLLGFLFWKLPATRNMLSVIAMGFAFAVASLWYLEPLLLLLQPALLGLGLAIAATVIDAGKAPARGGNSQLRLERRSTPLTDDLSNVEPVTRTYRPTAAGAVDRLDT